MKVIKEFIARYKNREGFKYCPICGEEGLQDLDQIKQMRIDGATIEYQSHSCSCGACGTEFVTSEQSRLNKSAVVAAKTQYLSLTSLEALLESINKEKK